MLVWCLSGKNAFGMLLVSDVKNSALFIYY